MIKKATLSDVDELCSLVNDAYRGENSKNGWTTEAYILQGIRIDENEMIATINQKNTVIFKYIENHLIIGCVLLKIEKESLYLGMLCVNPTLQNSGIGKKMLHFADKYAALNYIKKIKMTVISERLELILWYNRYGYVDSGIREPFPDNHSKDVISGEKLEFVVLEKQL